MSQTYALHASLGYQMSLTARLHERKFENRIKPLGLTRLTWCILLAVEGQGYQSPSEIALFVGIDRTATSRALRKMTADGLVIRASALEETPSDARTDGRRARISATADGRQRLAQATEIARQNALHFDTKLTSEERDTLQALLQKLQSGEDTPLAHI
jgi:DNA-binding MarR family transcriptional regulator